MMCCYYPTTTVAIDDDVDFLNTLTQHLGISNCIAHSSPNTALESFTQNQKPIDRIKSRIVKQTNINLEHENLSPEDHAVVINMRSLHEEIYNNNRFKDVSVIVVDYYMDGINGIDVCEALATHPAKKILLTGGADKEKVAIEAFNKGIINRFISKTDSNFPNKLKQAIALLKENYFSDLTLTLPPFMDKKIHNPYYHLPYLNLIRNVQNQFNIVEYYLLDTVGSVLMLNSEGDPIWFILKHKSEIKDYEQLAKDQEAPDDLINKLNQCDVLPFFFSDEDYQQPTDNWNNYLYKANPLPGLADYYYALIEHKIHNTIDYSSVLSYKCYKGSQ